MCEWNEYRLADIGQIVTGKTPPTSNPEFYGGEVPFVTPSDMDGRRTIDRTARKLSKLGAEKVRSSYINGPGIVVSCIGSDMGKAALINHPYVSNQQINSVIVGKKFDRFFLYYNLYLRKDEIQFKASGAAQPIMNKTDFGNLVLRAPCIKEQIAISSVLGALDDKVELNRWTNETLEAMARSLFKDWFVDFGPTRAKMEGRDPYLAPDLWAHFPDRLDDETGLPVGWENKPLGECLERLKVGKLYDQTSVRPCGRVPVLDQGKTGIIGFHDNVPTLQASAKRRISVFANHTCYQKLVDFDFSTIQNVIPFVGRGVPTEWLHYASLGKQKFEEYRGHWPSFVTHEVAVPGNGLTKQFACTIESLLEHSSKRQVECERLAEIRDLLMPKLMSGEIRLRDAEKISGEAA